jgi:hypothetical protein
MEKRGVGLGMSLREELLSSASKVLIISMSDGFKRAVWLGEPSPVKLAEQFFMSVWNRLMHSNPMFRTKYNLEAKL